MSWIIGLGETACCVCKPICCSRAMAEDTRQLDSGLFGKTNRLQHAASYQPTRLLETRGQAVPFRPCGWRMTPIRFAAIASYSTQGSCVSIRALLPQVYVRQSSREAAVTNSVLFAVSANFGFVNDLRGLVLSHFLTSVLILGKLTQNAHAFSPFPSPPPARVLPCAPTAR